MDESPEHSEDTQTERRRQHAAQHSSQQLLSEGICSRESLHINTHIHDWRLTHEEVQLRARWENTSVTVKHYTPADKEIKQQQSFPQLVLSVTSIKYCSNLLAWQSESEKTRVCFCVTWGGLDTQPLAGFGGQRPRLRLGLNHHTELRGEVQRTQRQVPVFKTPVVLQQKQNTN